MSGYIGTKAVTLSTTTANVGGDSTVGGDLTVDTNTLYVDSTNNNVGIGTTSLNKSSSSTALTVNTGTAASYAALELSSGDTLNWYINANNSDVYDVTAGSRNRIFYTNGSERLRILSSGGITFNGDTAAANALDDYETGTWTPIDGSGAGLTFVGSGGRFVRIGTVVNFAFRAHYPSTTDTNSAAISGLPFTSAATTGSLDVAGGWTSMLSQNFSSALFGYVPTSSTGLKIVKASSPSTVITNANASSFNIYGFGTYYIP